MHVFLLSFSGFEESASQPEHTAIEQNEEDNDGWDDDGSWYQRYRSDNQEKVVEAVKGNDHERDGQCRCRPLLCHKQSNHSQQDYQWEPGVHVYDCHTGEEIKENPCETQDH